ncbi:hypothetical protein QTG56_26120 (plasmid) [Rossellomorea sp. AcN35-11]|nr:hypothetical protein [Rossellomorea aquimaris]WJV32094.1 hypothetical protein QTG56_26120 [Rossellomorea sp. AcN35-11]
MKRGDRYSHFKGNDYAFMGIAIPLSDIPKEILGGMKKVSARYHEDTHNVDLYMLEGLLVLDAELPHVIYWDREGKKWAREVNDFFGYKHLVGSHYEKRFTLIK